MPSFARDGSPQPGCIRRGYDRILTGPGRQRPDMFRDREAPPECVHVGVREAAEGGPGGAYHSSVERWTPRPTVANSSRPPTGLTPKNRSASSIAISFLAPFTTS